MTIYALFLEDNKCLMKDDYKKSFDVDFNEKGLLKMLSAIKIQDDIVIFINDKKLYSKVRFSLDFKDYKVTKVPFFDENSKNKDFDWLNREDYIECSVKKEWQSWLGKEIIICNDRTKQIQLVNDLDLCTFMANDVTELRDNLINRNEIGDSLVNKMFCTDEEIEQLATQEGR